MERLPRRNRGLFPSPRLESPKREGSESTPYRCESHTVRLALEGRDMKRERLTWLTERVRRVLRSLRSGGGRTEGTGKRLGAGPLSFCLQRSTSRFRPGAATAYTGLAVSSGEDAAVTTIGAGVAKGLE